MKFNELMENLKNVTRKDVEALPQHKGREIEFEGKTYVSLLPHTTSVVVENKNGDAEVLTFTEDKNFTAPRLNKKANEDDENKNIIFNETTSIDNLPDAKDNAYFIVSAMMLGVNKRTDLLAPNTNWAIRENGQVVAALKFAGK